MKIVVDENIPFGKEAFGALGEVITLSGRSITSGVLKETKAEALMVRSVTKVGPELLKDSCVRFVGTATIGMDHIDLDYLKERKIGFSSAPGSNADSVAEYIVAALFCLAGRNNFKLEDKTLGVIGVGNVGSRVAVKAGALGMKVLLNDPPLARITNDPKYLALEDVFDADIITLHVPLNKKGQDATYHMVNEYFLSRMRTDSVFINTSRGPVVDEAALKQALVNKRIAAAALDVWENEPSIDTELLELAVLGTPHIAGYSFDGKVNGTFMIYKMLCQYLSIEPQWSPEEALSNKGQAPLVVDRNGLEPKEIEGVESNQSRETGLKEAGLARTGNTDNIINNLVKQLYDIEKDDRQLRKIGAMAAEEQGVYFDGLRKEYPARREFQSRSVKISEKHKDLSNIIRTLGFNVL